MLPAFHQCESGLPDTFGKSGFREHHVRPESRLLRAGFHPRFRGYETRIPTPAAATGIPQPAVLPKACVTGDALAYDSELPIYSATDSLRPVQSETETLILRFEGIDCMQSLQGRKELVARVQQALALPTTKEAERVVEAVVAALEAALLDNLGTDGFTLKLGSFGKFYVHHRPGTRRKIGFSGQTIQTKRLRRVKFISLGNLRRQERVD